MYHAFGHAFGAFARGKATQSANTVITQFIPPYVPPSGAPVGSGKTSDPYVNNGIWHVTDFVYRVSTTGHTITVMRPLNYTTLSADASASQAVVNISADPGLYQTSGRWKYALPNAQTAPSTANNAIAASDYVMYQAAAGQWVVDTVSSVSSLAITLTNNLPTGGAKKGALFYFFGITTDTDPATNEAHVQFDITAGSALGEYKLQSQSGLWHGLHQGDPAIFHSSNATAQGYFELLAGFWSEK